MGDQARLTLAELEAYRGQGAGKWSGGRLRYYCPIHGGDHQRSLALNPETGHFHCYACGAWGYLEEKKQEWIEERKRERAWRRPWPRRSREKQSSVPKPMEAAPRPQAAPQGPPARPDLAALLPELQAALPGSWGEEYLRRRGIPLELALACGVGYAAAGKWPHLKDGRPVRQWRWGRLVFPHTNPAGEVVNLYGRAVGSNEKVPKAERHDHLPGPKGVFNARALQEETVFICEGVFDALSLMAAGHPNTCAIFGVDGMRWEWVRARRIVLALDQDQAGQRAWQELAREGLLRGFEVYFLPAAAYAGHKDLNEAWVATGRLDIGEWEAPPKAWDEAEGERLVALAMERVVALWAAGESAEAEQLEEALNRAYQLRDREALERLAKGGRQ